MSSRRVGVRIGVRIDIPRLTVETLNSGRTHAALDLGSSFRLINWRTASVRRSNPHQNAIAIPSSTSSQHANCAKPATFGCKRLRW